MSGMSDAITKCIYHICMIMLEVSTNQTKEYREVGSESKIPYQYEETLKCLCLFQSPPKGGTIPYRPRPGPAGPAMVMGQGGGGGGYGMQGNYGMNPAEVRPLKIHTSQTAPLSCITYIPYT